MRIGIISANGRTDVYNKQQGQKGLRLQDDTKDKGVKDLDPWLGAVSYTHLGILYTAPADNLILPGIARSHLIQNCKKLGIPVSETPYTLKELMDADEVLVTSSTKLCMSADEIDGRPVGGKRCV